MKLNSLFNIAVFPFAVAALSVIGFSNQAKAVIFSGNISGKWGEPVPESINTDPIYNGVGTNEFTWGDPTPFKNASSNKLVFEGNSFSTDTDSLFKIGDLTYRNGTVLLGTSVEYVPLKLGLSFNKPTELDKVLNYEFDYEFSLKNTINKFVDPEEDADFLYVTNNEVKPSFTYGGDEYTLSLTGFSQDNGTTYVSEFRVLEQETTTASIYAQINKVPKRKKVPESGFAVGLSIVGIYLISRKKAKKTQ